MPISTPMIFLTAISAARVTRLVTTDWLGEWMICEPLKKWAFTAEGDVDVHQVQVFQEQRTADGHIVVREVNKHEGPTWRSKLVSGLDCPHCVGFWATVLMFGLSALPLSRPVARIRDTLIGMLAGSYVVGHISASLDS